MDSEKMLKLVTEIALEIMDIPLYYENNPNGADMYLCPFCWADINDCNQTHLPDCLRFKAEKFLDCLEE